MSRIYSRRRRTVDSYIAKTCAAFIRGNIPDSARGNPRRAEAATRKPQHLRPGVEARRLRTSPICDDPLADGSTSTAGSTEQAMTDDHAPRTDDQVQHHVEDALDWADPAVDASRIGVTVDGGVVTLRGGVETGAEKVTAERVALLVCGVKGVINDLAVRVVPGREPTDAEIAEAAVTALDHRRAGEWPTPRVTADASRSACRLLSCIGDR